VTWESRWPLNIFSDMDATKLSDSMRTRLQDAERMTVDEYRRAISERESIRTAYAELMKSENLDACMTLSANGPAPVGIESTGDPGFATPCSYLGVPSVSLPLMSVNGLPVGIQLMGSRNKDAELFSIASTITPILT
jgi:Asp-tRNA(Asn)/Glu-tRNA(Gln) amidotransferase A subunit family amidase